MSKWYAAQDDGHQPHIIGYGEPLEPGAKRQGRFEGQAI